MLDLKPYLDAANAASDEVQRLVNEIDVAFNASLSADSEAQRIMQDMDAALKTGTEEGKSQALALRPALTEVQKKAETSRALVASKRPELEKAKAKAEEADSLYRSMRSASLTDNGNAARFAPLKAAVAAPDKPDAKVMQRADFDALPHSQRSKFMRSGGTVEA